MNSTHRNGLLKRFAVIFALATGCGSVAEAQTNFYTTVTNLWYQGHKSNVLAMADARLQQNTNDLAALIIKVEYDIDFTRDAHISNSVNRALTVALLSCRWTLPPRVAILFPFLWRRSRAPQGANS